MFAILTKQNKTICCHINYDSIFSYFLKDKQFKKMVENKSMPANITLKMKAIFAVRYLARNAFLFLI